MHEIQLIILRFMRFLLVALLFPVLVMLVIAAINERIRRIVLWVMAVLAFLALVAYLILAPRNMATVEDWNQGAAALKDALLSGLPFIIGLAVVGAGAYLFGPAIRTRAEEALQRHARNQYLIALLDWVAPQLEGMVELEGRELVPAASPSLRITGEPGSGKSTLLRQILQFRARYALANESAPLPVWIDMDDSLTTSADLQVSQLAPLSPVQTRFLGWLLQREISAGRLSFFIDGSVQSYGMAYARSQATGVQNAASALAELIQSNRGSTFMVAMPPEAADGTLLHLLDLEQRLAPLSREGIRLGANALLGGAAEKLNALLAADSGIWHMLATRPVFLQGLAVFFRTKKRLPNDLRELFRAVLYPPQMDAEQVESALACLAEKNLQSGQYWQRESALQRDRAKAPAPVVRGLVQCGLLRSLPAAPGRGRPEPLVGFAHPIFLAYATALSWFANRVIPIEVEKNGQSPLLDLDGAGPKQARALQEHDPVLADALVFFNSLESDPERLAGMLAALTGAGDGTFRWFLAAQCLLAMPPAKRPRSVVEKTAGEMIKLMAYDEQAAMQAKRLLEPYEEASRIAVYSPILNGMDEMRLEQTLRRITERAPGEGEANYPDFLRSVLWYGDEGLSRLTGWVWANCEPRETAALAQELYEHGPAERRGMAVELMSKLPEATAAQYLNNLLRVESSPALRIAALKSLAACGAEQTGALLAILADGRESDAVRNYAAERLSQGERPELREGGTVRELVRISYLPLPEKAQYRLQEVMEKLRGVVPETTTRWEEVVNPYLVGRPVTAPALFVGREQILRDLQIAVDNANPALITGERGSGKTSLLYRLASALEEEARRGVPVRAVFFDLAGLHAHEFYETAIRTIIEGLHDPDLIADPNVPRPYADAHFARDLRDVLAHVQAKMGAQSRVALLIDNAEVLAGYPAAMHAALKRVLEGALPYGLVALLAGSDALRAQTLPAQPASQGTEQPAEAPFYRDWLKFILPRLTREETMRLITAPVAGTFQYEDAVVERIVQAAQGRPDMVQSVCQKLISQALATGSRTITAKVAAEALQGTTPRADLLAQSDSVLNQMMDWLEANPDASNAQMEEQMKQAWGALQKAIVQQVVRARKGKG